MGRKKNKKKNKNKASQRQAKQAAVTAPKVEPKTSADVVDSSQKTSSGPTIDTKSEEQKTAQADSKAKVDDDTLLEIRDLRTYFYTDEGVVKAVNGVNLKIAKGETLGIVGESACGKSVTAFSIMRLIPSPPGKIVGGQILFKGKDLVTLSEPEMQKIRGKEIAMIFQEPMTSLNPVYTIGNQISEVLMLHRNMTKQQAWDYSAEMLQKVGIPEPHSRLNNFPHEMSGGMKQRVMIAMALACEPSLLMADEPTTALDVTIQAQILELMRRLQSELGMSIWFITHDLGVIAELAHKVAVMYASRVVEHTDVDTLFASPRHPYTRGLFQSLPHLGVNQKRLNVIQGQVPNPLNHPSGCRFHTRCEFVVDECKTHDPQLVEISPGHQVACLRVERGEVLFEV